jgi:hypothetical protein
MTARPDRQAIQAEILRQIAALAPGKSISPSDVAKALQPEGWQSLLALVRQAAVALAREGKIEVLRKGKPAELDDLRGVIRLRAPFVAPAVD